MNGEEIIDLFKKNKALLIIVAFSFVVLVGSSYAWYTITLSSDKEHTIKAGTMELLLQDHKDNVTLVNAVPQTDEAGMKNASYNFTVTNTGSISSRYSVYLEDTNLTVGTSRMSDSVLKYALNTGDISVNKGYLSSLDNISGKRKLVSGELEPNASVTYNLRIWIAEEATSEISGQEFITKLSIEGKQLNQPVED